MSCWTSKVPNRERLKISEVQISSIHQLQETYSEFIFNELNRYFNLNGLKIDDRIARIAMKIAVQGVATCLATKDFGPEIRG